MSDSKKGKARRLAEQYGMGPRLMQEAFGVPEGIYVTATDSTNSNFVGYIPATVASNEATLRSALRANKAKVAELEAENAAVRSQLHSPKRGVKIRK